VDEVARLWRVEALVPFPTEIPLGPDGGLPEQLEPQPRITTQAGHIDGIRVGLRPVPPEDLPGVPADLRWSWGAVALETDALDGQRAIDAAMEPLEAALESLSFQLQVPLQIQSIEALDVTPPITEGDERPTLIYPIGADYPLRRYRPASVQMSGVETQRHPSLGLTLAQLNNRERAALDWYLKALAAPFQMDQFIFLWIASEVLWTQSGISVEGPYRADCGHEIPNCPTCDRTTSRQVRGRSIQRFFVEVFGIQQDTARRLWRARQVIHGAERFDSMLIDTLDELIQILRTGVNASLKRALGTRPADPPLVAAGQLSVAPQMALGGTRKVAPADLAELGRA